jgi:hypothetical protein
VKRWMVCAALGLAIAGGIVTPDCRGVCGDRPVPPPHPHSPASEMSGVSSGMAETLQKGLFPTSGNRAGVDCVPSSTASYGCPS